MEKRAIKLIAGVLAVFLATFGLAYAGGALSDSTEGSLVKAEKAEKSDEENGKSDESEGKSDEEHESQGDGSAVSAAVAAAKDTDAEGCERGHAIATAAHDANGGDQENELGDCDSDDDSEAESNAGGNRFANGHDKVKTEKAPHVEDEADDDDSDDDDDSEDKEKAEKENQSDEHRVEGEDQGQNDDDHGQDDEDHGGDAEHGNDDD